MDYALYIILGLVAGIFGGMFGIGGGTILIPAMVFLFGLRFCSFFRRVF